LDNIEVKYLVALDKRIDFKDKKKDVLADAFGTQAKTQEENKIEVSDLKNRIEKIFDENIQYNQIKEKLIGNTIYYRPELKDVLINIVSNDIKEDNIKEFILKYSKELIQLLENERHINIRTLRIAINKFAQVIYIINDIEIDNNELLEEILYNVLIYTLYSTIKNKTGQKEYMWEEFSEYGNIYIGRKKIAAFKFIDRLVNKGVVNKENVKHVISEYLENLKTEGSNINDPLNKLLGYWELEDDVIINNINDLIKKIEKNEYQLEQYPKIIALVMRIKNMGFDKEYLEKVIELMKNNIKVTDIKQSRFDEFGVMLNSKLKV
jgi:polyhydroxyalkanoate synthesis regulator phasin